jgi:hypothetical protein
MSDGMTEVYTSLVRFLRMLTNSLVAGGLAAAYLTVLLLQLNPQIPLVSSTSARWFLTLVVLYGLSLAALFYVLLIAQEFFSMRLLSPGWASVRVLAWLAAGSALAAATLMWLNVDGLSNALEATAARRMTAGAIATTGSAVVLLAIAVAHYSSGRHGSPVGAALFVIGAFGSLALPLAARGPAVELPAREASGGAWLARSSARGPRVRMVLLDGASLEYIWPRAADGRLPNFARLLDAGASMDLATIRPTAPDPVWAAAATGVYPARNGVRSAARYFARGDDRPLDLLPDHCFSHALVQLGLVRDVRYSSAEWHARPLWSILADAGIPVGVVRWPLTYPVEAAGGFVVSDRFHELASSAVGRDARAAYPWEALALAGLSDAEDRRGLEASAAVRDRLYSHALSALRAEIDVQLSAIRYQGLDSFGHVSMKYAQQSTDSAGDSDPRRAAALDRHYAFIDEEIGATLERTRPGDLLLVVSGFGMQRLDVVKAFVARIVSGEDVSGTHERAPDGFLIAYGSDIEPGRHKRGSIVDVTPTVLYFFGLPVGRDMDGFARADLFNRAFTSEHPIAFIPSYGR